jgi:DNA ligase-1
MDDDFTALMRQVRRKTDADVSNSYLSVFDYVTLDEWNTRMGAHSMKYRRKFLEGVFEDHELKGVHLIEQKEVDRTMEAISTEQIRWEGLGYEGAMVKSPDAVYKFGRSKHMLKVKSFHDIDLEVIGFKEGTGKHVGKLGSILVDCKGVEVNVGSGFNDEQRVEIWENRERYLGMTAECRYQEMTEDGSLRFPTFVHWRLDR